MSSPIIKVENLGKRYRLHHEKQERYTTLRDVIARKARGLAEKLKSHPSSQLSDSQLSASQPFSLSASQDEDFWALKDLSFEIKQGEVVGIIGRNGAGKSTLLKILSRITEPTTGRIILRGRVASLLEVGTGFHPELTGRENIFLNGAILGMGKAEIRNNFDAIVAFAEVEKFLDTPVKRYSSGMYVRLAFAVAAHLEPEILVVDEVLAVGDAEFQKKCLGKMKDVSANGRTVLFVSHQLDTIRSLCSRAIQLHAGTLKTQGDVGEVITSYLRTGRASSFFEKEELSTKPIQIVSAAIEENDALGHWLQVHVVIKASTTKTCSLDVRLTDGLGSAVGYGSFGTLCSDESVQLELGRNDFRFSLDSARLAEGTYALSLDISHPHVEYFDRAEQCLEFSINQSNREGRTRALLQTWGYGSNELQLYRISGKLKQ
ncbi:MAG: ABC transporter ATP-binding protein [Verrucomicrobiaceae bacterium]